MQAKEKFCLKQRQSFRIWRRRSPLKRVGGTISRAVRPNRPSLKGLRAVALIVISSWACLSCRTSSKWWQSCVRTEQQTASVNVETTAHLVVYLDVSESMKGFVAARRETEAASAQTVYSKSLLALRNVVTTLQPQTKAVVRLIDKEVHPPTDVFELAQYAINRDWYNRKETNLAGAINNFQEPVEAKVDANDKTPPARFHILVTDGVQSTKERRSDVRCLQGSDIDCVKEKISELVAKGWGGTILGVRSDFNGLLFSETSPSLSFEYSSTPDNPATFRPFYLYIFSPDQAALEMVVKKVKEVLRPLMTSPDQLREYSLASPYVTGPASGQLLSTNKEVLTVKKDDAASAEDLCFTVDLASSSGQQRSNAQAGDNQTPDTAPLILTLRISWSQHALDSGTPQEIAGMLKWELMPHASITENGARYPEVRVVKSTANPDGSVSLHLTARWEDRLGKRRERIYRLVGHLDVDKEAPPWVGQWSTDTDATKDEAPRTLNLKILLANLWKTQFLQRQEIAVACLRVGDF
jgi:hypothetical protein